jgi:hypothetical protein
MTVELQAWLLGFIAAATWRDVLTRRFIVRTDFEATCTIDEQARFAADVAHWEDA